MSLTEEIESARHKITKDGYDMSLGEIMNLYSDGELIINPDFQRYFRWNRSQKTRFIESILLEIPIPPIFVYQRKDGIWELIDGLQRLSTILEFTGLLRPLSSTTEAEEVRVEEVRVEEEDFDEEFLPLSVLDATKSLPSLEGMQWKDNGEQTFTKALQLEFKRARIRVEILKQESDQFAKYELFQRLNTGGSKLSEQEIRNSIATMIDKTFLTFIKELSTIDAFRTTINLSEKKVNEQMNLELVLRFIAVRHRTPTKGFDVNEYLTDSIIEFSSDKDFDYKKEREVFTDTFSLLNATLGIDSFKRWDGTKFIGQFIMSAYETVSFGISENIDELKNIPQELLVDTIKEKMIQIHNHATYIIHSGSGVRASTRLPKLLDLGKDTFRV